MNFTISSIDLSDIPDDSPHSSDVLDDNKNLFPDQETNTPISFVTVGSYQSSTHLNNISGDSSHSSDVLDDNSNSFPADQETNIPIAFISMGRELVIEGVIVTPPVKPKLRYIIEIILFLITILCIGIFSLIFNPQSSSETNSNLSISDILYDDFIKQIALPISGEDILDDPTTVQHRLWKGMAVTMPVMIEKSIVQINDTNKIAQLYIALVVGFSTSNEFRTNGIIADNDPRLLMDYCLITPCNDDGQVIGLVLRNERVSRRGGGIIAREIGAMHNITHIITSRSALRGTIPSDVGKLENLRVLILRDSSFTGTIPTQIGQLTNLEVLLLDNNLLDGTIPSELGNLKNLRYLGLSENTLSGLVPTDLKALRNLTSVALESNNVTGNENCMCNDNMLNGTNVVELEVGSHRYLYDVELGISKDCAMIDEEVVCSCCRCINKGNK